MEPSVKRKILIQTDTPQLRSATNTPATSPTSGAIKIKANGSTITRSATISGRQSPMLRSRTPLKVDTPSNSLRSPSPIRVTAKSSPVTRVTSPDFQSRFKSIPSPAATTHAAPKAKVSAMTIAKRGEASRVASPTPSQGSALRSAASVYSLPSVTSQVVVSPPSGSQTLQPRVHRHHPRNNSVSDTSSLSTHSPSSSSVGTYEGNLEPTTSRVRSVVMDSNGGPAAVNSQSPPTIRVKSKISSLAVATPNGSPVPSPTALTSPNSLRKTSISSVTARAVGTPRPRSSSISSAVSTPPGSNHRPTSSSSRIIAKAVNIHTNHYQPFHVPPLPAPPPPEEIEGVLTHSPPRPMPKSTPGSPVNAIFPRARAGSPGSPVLTQRAFSPESVTTPTDEHGHAGFSFGDPLKPLREPISAVQDQEADLQTEARSHRKIEDLEITNRSLMAINSMLEATKAKQAKEIRELRRKLRETRLILPPKAFAALRTSEAHTSEQSDTAEPPPAGSDEDEEDEEDSFEGEPDLVLNRIHAMVDNMLNHANDAIQRLALPYEEEDVNRTKVLTAAELERYHKRTTNDTDHEDVTEDEHTHDETASIMPSESEADTMDLDASAPDDSFTSDYSPRPRPLPSPSPTPPRLTITSDSPIARTRFFHDLSPTKV